MITILASTLADNTILFIRSTRQSCHLPL